MSNKEIPFEQYKGWYIFAFLLTVFIIVMGVLLFIRSCHESQQPKNLDKTYVITPRKEVDA